MARAPIAKAIAPTSSPISGVHVHIAQDIHPTSFIGEMSLRFSVRHRIAALPLKHRKDRS
jgi:hypothetical protein